MKKLLLILTLLCSGLLSRAQTIQELAESSFNKQDYVTAYDQYTAILKTDPQNIKALRRAGFCLMNCKGQELNATRFFTGALKIEPNDPVSNYYLGIIFMDAAKDSPAIKERPDFKAKAAFYLKKAATCGSVEANAALKELNTI